MTTQGFLPNTGRGRRSAAKQAEYDRQLEAFYRLILDIDSTLDFKVSARGWCYILEEYGLLKGEFDRAQAIMAEARKSGALPIDITAEDAKRATINEDRGTFHHNMTPEQYLESEAGFLRGIIRDLGMDFQPWPFWRDQPYYVEMLVEKIDLKSLFEGVCEHYYVPLTNAVGWADIHSRANMMRRFKEREKEGRRCVLLYCGDHDPGGLDISKQLRKNLGDLVNAQGINWSPDDLIIDRFGLNYEFITEQNLSWVDNLETSSGRRLDDPRHPDHRKPYVQDYLAKYGARKVEANALVTRPKAGRELCRNAIERYISPEAVQRYEQAIESERQSLRQHIPEVVQAVAREVLGQ